MRSATVDIDDHETGVQDLGGHIPITHFAEEYMLFDVFYKVESHQSVHREGVVPGFLHWFVLRRRSSRCVCRFALFRDCQ